jgi:hypothetical protein
MYVRYLVPALWAVLLILGTGCQESPQMPSELPPLASNTVLRAHWIGKRQLGVEGSAFYFTRLWNLPATGKIQTHAFERLTTAPWRLLKGDAALATAPADTLRPLLDSLVYEESYLEIRATNDSPLQLALAIHLDKESAGGWQTNLAIAVQSLTGFPPVPGRGNLPGWTVIHPQAPARVEFARAGDWTVFGIATTAGNQLMDDLINRVSSRADPFGARGTNVWMRLDADLNWLSSTLGGTTVSARNLPSLSAAVTGDGGHVLTDCELTFPEPFRGDLQPWTMPADAIEEPLTSFMAVRGLRSIFIRLPGWNQLPLGEGPDQAYAWSRAGNAFQLYLTTPLPDAQARMNTLGAHLLNQVNPWLKDNGPEVNGQPCPLFHELPGALGVQWGHMEGLQPFVQAISANGTNFLLTGLIRPTHSQKTESLRRDLIRAMTGPTNLVCFGWEDTSSRVDGWLPVLQTARALTGKTPLPDPCPSLQWLQLIKPRLGETQTAVTRVGSNGLRIQRRSSIGFNAAELQLIADWLESPQFPRGLYTFLRKPPQPQAP